MPFFPVLPDTPNFAVFSRFCPNFGGFGTPRKPSKFDDFGPYFSPENSEKLTEIEDPLQWKHDFFTFFPLRAKNAKKPSFHRIFPILQIFPNFAKIQKNVKNCPNLIYNFKNRYTRKNSSSTFSRSATTSSWTSLITTVIHFQVHLLLLRCAGTHQSVESSWKYGTCFQYFC